MAHALADSGARILILERGDFVPQEAENWNPEAVWKHLRYRTTERWLDERGAGVPSVHALLRRRQHEVLGQRALSAAPRGLSGARARRRRLAGLADRLRHAGAVLRPRRAALSRARRARRRSDRAAARAVSVRAGSARAEAWRRSSSGCGAQGLHPSPLPLGLLRPAKRRLRPLQHLQLVPVQAPREERSRRVLRAPGARAAERHAVDQRVRAPADHRRRRATGSRPSRSRRTARRCASRRRCSSCRAARSTRRRCCCGRRTTAIPTAWRIRPGWSAALHGAPRDDDAGVPSVPEERDRVSEDGRDQRLLSSRARTRRIRSGRSSRRGGRTGSWRRRSCRQDSAVWAYEAWVSRGVDWLAMSEDLPTRRQSRDAGRRTAASACTTARTT